MPETDCDELRSQAEALHARAAEAMAKAAKVGKYHPTFVRRIQAVAAAETAAEKVEAVIDETC